MAKLSIVKVTLSSGRVVLLRTMKIKDTEMAGMLVARRAGDSSNLMQLLMQKELVKLLLIKVGDETLTGEQKEDLDSVFNVQEYGQLLKVIGKMSGAEDDKVDPKMEMVADHS